MRIRRKKWAREELDSSAFYIDKPEEFKGTWKCKFPKEQPLHIELGCGKGSFIANLASQNKNINYIAVDMIEAMLGLTKRNIEQAYNMQKPENLLLIRANVEQIQNVFSENDVVDRIYINFCNPWPKLKHNKRRLTHTKQLNLYKEFLSSDGELYFKTDSDELFATIGYGGILLSKIMPRIREEYNKRNASAKPTVAPEIKTKTSHSPEGVVVEGIDNCLIKLSRCCAPLPGDEIIGFITRGHGVSIHKRDCSNVPKDISSANEPERWIPAYWANGGNESFISTLQITGVDREGILVDIMNAINNMRVAVHSVSAKQTKEGNCIIIVSISAESVEHLRSITARLEKVSGVFHVERLGR